MGIGLATGIADLNVTYLRLLSTKTYHISYGGPLLWWTGTIVSQLILCILCNVFIYLFYLFIFYAFILFLSCTSCTILIINKIAEAYQERKPGGVFRKLGGY